MASRFQQQVLLRKVVYLVLILVLLTVSLMHRRFFVIPQAYNLQLREEARGEVELTSSAVRLTLTGLRGLATCSLWLEAIEKQRKHEWNELELLVRSITKVQPYFVSPWLFQSWNLSFNVAVECDRVRDKYFYISRGLELLAEGERRNQGGDLLTAGESKRLRFPGNPEMRFYMGFTYQLKVGQGDEQDALRCLYDMSCIDPVERDADALLVAGKTGQEVDLVKFEKFCRKYPRLVRRLRESALGLDTPMDVVNFLRDNREVPSRYEKPQLIPGAERQATPLKALTERFPILPTPPPERLAELGLKDRDRYDLDIPAGEDFDVYMACKQWYEYAQQPLPPPNPDPGVDDDEFMRRNFNPLLHRMPKMAQQIFRAYPARSQAYHAENLEKEGWFDYDPNNPSIYLRGAWLITKWFDPLRSAERRRLTGHFSAGSADAVLAAGQLAPVNVFQLAAALEDVERDRIAERDRVGTESKYHAGPEWDKAHTMYKKYGVENGLYLSPQQVRDLNEKSQLYVLRYGGQVIMAPTELSARDRQAGLAGSFAAAMKLRWNGHYRTMTNFDSYLSETGVERLPEAVACRKAIFQAERLRRYEAEPRTALELYEGVVPRWLEFLLAHPELARISVVQEDTYEAQMRYLRLLQGQRDSMLKPLVTGMAQLTLTLPVPLHKAPTYADEQAKIIPIRSVRGPFEEVFYYDAPGVEQLREALFDLGQAAIRPRLPLPPSLQAHLVSRLLVITRPRFDFEAAGAWRPLIEDDVIRQVRDRLGITRRTVPEPAPAAAPGR
jgi:hypothetical protein